jgi:hypothetical protein
MKIRVNDLARELQTKAKAIIGILPEIGVSRETPITTSTELLPEEAAKVRSYLMSRKTDPVTLGLAKSIAARFGEEI